MEFLTGNVKVKTAIMIAGGHVCFWIEGDVVKAYNWCFPAWALEGKVIALSKMSKHVLI
jgi:hypothetical protein